MNFIPSSSNKERGVRLLYVFWALAVAILYDIFFWQKDMGLGFLVFVVLLVVGTVVLLAATKHLRQTWALLLAVPIFILSLDIVLYNNLLVKGPASLIVAGLLLVLFILLPLRNHDKVSYYFRDIPLIRNLQFFKHWATMYRDLFRWKDIMVQRDYKKVAIGLVIAAPILLIFLALFTSADAVFAEALKRLFNFTLPDNAWIFIWRMLRTVGITVLLGGLFYIFIHEEHAPIKGIIRSVMKFDSTIVTVIFTTVNLLFFIFVIFQISYLFGNQAYVMEKGLTYAEYARSGFFQLAWVIALASLLLLVPYRSFAEHGLKKVLVALKLILIIEILVIAFSALKRMNLYQDMYGFTTQRLYVEWLIYMAMVWLVMLSVAIVSRWKFKRLFYATVCLGLASFVIVASINVDRMIARKDVRRFVEEGKKFDLPYLTRLSVDAFPEVISLTTDQNIHKLSVEQMKELQNYFSQKLAEIDEDASWREFNFGRNQVRMGQFQIPKQLRAAAMLDYNYTTFDGLVESNAVNYCNLSGYGVVSPGGNVTDYACRFVELPDGQGEVAILLEKSYGIGVAHDMSILIFEPTGGISDLNLTKYHYVTKLILESSSLKKNNIFGLVRQGYRLYPNEPEYQLTEVSPEDKQFYVYSLIKEKANYQLKKIRKSKTFDELMTTL